MRRITFRNNMEKTTDLVTSIFSVLENTINLQELDDESLIDELDVIIDNAPDNVIDTLNSYFMNRKLTFTQREVLNRYYILYYSIAIGMELN